MSSVSRASLLGPSGRRRNRSEAPSKPGSTKRARGADTRLEDGTFIDEAIAAKARDVLAAADAQRGDARLDRAR